MAGETTARVSKLPNRYSDCITGYELDELENDIRSECLESPIKHEQVDGKTNNVTFKTTRTDAWKNAIIDYFGKPNTNVQYQKSYDVIKVTFELENEQPNSVKINLFHSGSVVIQGAKCANFSDSFFHSLKQKQSSKTYSSFSSKCITNR